jgi:DNA modification methylase
MYADRMRKQKFYELSFEPKSFWNYNRGNNLDILINDQKSYENNQTDNFIGKGRGTFLSKFNSEYAKRILEMWSKKDDLVIDPFAGRSSRPLVSTLLNRNYIGFDVINDNLKEAQQQYDKLKNDRSLGKLKLINESSENIDKHIDKNVADLIMTCPPYFNIEKYESVNGQLTDIETYDEFLNTYSNILNKSVNVLKKGGFFIIVLANFRIDGKFYDFVGDTKNILKQSLDYHDEIILEMSPAKRHPLYVQAITNLNCLKTHEYCIVFRKADIKEKIIDRNNEINWNRPLVKDIYLNRDKLFWAEGKKDWIDDHFMPTNNLEKFF